MEVSIGNWDQREDVKTEDMRKCARSAMMQNGTISKHFHIFTRNCTRVYVIGYLILGFRGLTISEYFLVFTCSCTSMHVIAHVMKVS